MGVVISYVVALIMNAMGITNPDGSAILNFSSVSTANWIGLPPMQFAKFDVTAILVMAPIAIATMMEHVGDMSPSLRRLEKTFWQNPDFTEHCLEMVLLQLWQAFSADRPIPPTEKIPAFWN